MTGGASLPWLQRWFRDRHPELEIPLDQDFYRAQLLNSFEFVVLLGDIESVFSLELDFRDLQAPSARTLRGLAALLDGKRGPAG